jgi:hypothetical protein
MQAWIFGLNWTYDWWFQRGGWWADTTLFFMLVTIIVDLKVSWVFIFKIYLFHFYYLNFLVKYLFFRLYITFLEVLYPLIHNLRNNEIKSFYFYIYQGYNTSKWTVKNKNILFPTFLKMGKLYKFKIYSLWIKGQLTAVWLCNCHHDVLIKWESRKILYNRLVKGYKWKGQDKKTKCKISTKKHVKTDSLINPFMKN